MDLDLSGREIELSNYEVVKGRIRLKERIERAQSEWELRFYNYEQNKKIIEKMRKTITPKELNKAILNKVETTKTVDRVLDKILAELLELDYPVTERGVSITIYEDCFYDFIYDEVAKILNESGWKCWINRTVNNNVIKISLVPKEI